MTLAPGSRDKPALSRFQEDLGKSFQFLCRPVNLGSGKSYVELRDLRAIDSAAVLYREADAITAGCKSAVFKCRVGETETERILHRHTRRVVVAVTDKETFAVFRCSLFCGIIIVCRGLLKLYRVGLGQLT